MTDKPSPFVLFSVFLKTIYVNNLLCSTVSSFIWGCDEKVGLFDGSSCGMNWNKDPDMWLNLFNIGART